MGHAVAGDMRQFDLPTLGRHLSRMFMVDKATIDAARRAYEESGKLSALAELRRRFRGVADNVRPQLCAGSVTG